MRDVDFGSWGFCLVRRRLLLGLGLPSTRFRPGFYSDGDASFSLRAAGWRVLYQPYAHVIRYDGTSTSGGARAGWGAWLSASSEAAVETSARLSTHGVPGDMHEPQSQPVSRRDQPEARRRAAQMNQAKFSSKWATALRCHLAPSDLQPWTLENSGGASVAEVATAAVASAGVGRFATAGGVLKAFDSKIQAAAQPADGFGDSVARAVSMSTSRVVEAVAGRASSLRVLFVDWIAPEVDRDSGSIRARYMLQVWIRSARTGGLNFQCVHASFLWLSDSYFNAVRSDVCGGRYEPPKALP